MSKNTYFSRADYSRSWWEDGAMPSSSARNHGARNRRKPNYFVAFRVSDSKIHQSVDTVQKDMVSQDRRLEKYLSKLCKLHITLMVMHIKDEEEHTRAVDVLKAIHGSYNEHMSRNPLHLEFRGLGNFNNKVLFARVTPGRDRNRLLSFAKDINRHFEEASIRSTDRRKEINPHLTVIKLKSQSMPDSHDVSEINPSFYSWYKNQCFGTQVVDGIQLLKMHEEDESGYYAGTEFLFDFATR